MLGRAITFKNPVARRAIRIFWRISRPDKDWYFDLFEGFLWLNGMGRVTEA